MNEKDLYSRSRKFLKKIKESILPRSSIIKKKDITSLESEDLIKAENLMNGGKLEEALLIINDLERMEDLPNSNLILCYLLKSFIFFRTGKFEEGLEVAKKAFKQSQRLKNNLLKIDSLLSMARLLLALGSYEKCPVLVTQSEDLYNKLSKVSESEMKQRKALIAYVKAHIHWFQGNMNEGLKYAKQSLELNEEVGGKNEIAESLYAVGQFLCIMQVNLDQALIYLERSFNLAKELNNLQLLALTTICFGAIYINEGEFSNALTAHNKGLAIAEGMGNKQMIVVIKNNLSMIFKSLGEWDNAIKNSKESIEMAREAGFKYHLLVGTASLIEILVYKGDIKQAQLHLEELELLSSGEDQKVLELSYRYCQAIILKASPRTHNRAKAEEILKQIIQEEIINAEITINALINLCDLLLEELKSTSDFEILNELEPLIAQLLTIADGSNSNWILAETYTLQAKLALLTSDPNKARRLLIKAQEIAEELSKWEDLKDKDLPLNERMELAHIDDQMKSLLWDRDLSSLEYIDEDPVVLIILAEGGVTIFSHIFSSDWTFQDDLIGGFLSAMNSFSGELFSEGLNRVNFGKHTVIMKPFASFFACYLFKGQSYLANKKITKFIKNIETNEMVIIIFESYYKNHQTIILKENPPLEELFTDIFIQKKA